ncbi:hypothetical protein KRX57_00140 [Weeksellaceae bacterium TAE3-ERU29]|nr:hypothetical protein [Weeksellaceae bacterium TAE3-ERU29]
MVFWLSIGVATWILHPQLIAENKFFIITIIVLEIACYVISWIKFGKETCTHAFHLFVTLGVHEFYFLIVYFGYRIVHLTFFNVK